MPGHMRSPNVRASGRYRRFTPRLCYLGAASVLSLVLASCGGASDPASAGGGGPFYEGKTIRIIVPVGAGASGIDIGARLFAEKLSEKIEGNPEIQVVNIDGGGDGRIGANEFAEADPDGLTLLAAASDTHERPLFGSGQENVKWDFSKMTPIIGTQTGSVIAIRTDTGVKTAEDLLKYDGDLFYGATGPSGAFLVRSMGLDMLGVDYEALFGYEATAAVVTSFEQGETNIYGFSSGAYLNDGQPLVDAGIATPLMDAGVLENGEVVEDEQYPDLPSIAKVYQDVNGKPPSGELWEAIKFYMATQSTLDQCLYILSSAPPEAIEALQTAAEELANDQAFLDEAKDIIGDYPILYGDHLQGLIQDFLIEYDPAVRDYLVQYVKDKYDTDMTTDF